MAVGLLVGLPGLIWIAWLVSGREVFTKGGKAMQVAVRDELFGDVSVLGKEIKVGGDNFSIIGVEQKNGTFSDNRWTTIFIFPIPSS